MENILKLLLSQPSDLLDQLYENKSSLKPIHLAVAAEQKMRDVCLYIKGHVDDSACSETAKEYLATLEGYSLSINFVGKFWQFNGQTHREDGPAYEDVDGSKTWWLNGQRHREDGPAVEDTDGTKAWYLNGKKVSEQDVLDMPLTKSLQSLIDQHGKEKLYIALSKI